MRKRVIVLALAAAGATAATAERDAHALGPVDLEVGAKAGVGTNPFSGPNPLGFGVGARAGLAFTGLYGGLSFMYYFGSGQDTSAGNISDKALLYGIEAGYGSTLFSLLTLRFQLGVGNFQVTESPSNNGGSNLYLEPGVTALVSLGMFFVGADVNALVLPGVADPLTGGSSWQAALTTHGQVGVKF